jgi:hypothetical protein
VVAAERVPDDDQAVDQELERDGALDGPPGAVAGLADPEGSLALDVGRFNRPAVCVPRDDLFGGGGEVCGEQRQILGTF